MLSVDGFDDDAEEWADDPDAQATGTSYMLVDNFGGAWSDCEKSPTDTDDDLLCWAASSANVLQWTGWGRVAGMTTADAMFTYFQDHFTDDGGYADNGWDWWFDGTCPAGGATENVEGGAFFPAETPTNYYERNDYAGVGDRSPAMGDIDTHLHNGRGVALSLGGVGGHGVTCWGYNYTTGDPDDYLGIWITDSDDDKHLANPTDRLRYYEVELVNNSWCLQDYYGSDNWYIRRVYSLARSPDSVTVDAGAAKDNGTADTFSVSTSNNIVTVTVNGSANRTVPTYRLTSLTINGSSDVDTISLASLSGVSGFTSHLNGSGANDSITGSQYVDVIYASTGNDTIYGGSGNDEIHGDAGSDYIYGQQGNDSLYGDADADYIRGDNGYVEAYKGHDCIFGGTGNDSLYGDGGNDTITGDADQDYILGDWGYFNDYYASYGYAPYGGSDSLLGGTGNDTIRGELSGDTLSGQDGNDLCYGDFAWYGGYGEYGYLAYGGSDLVDGGENNDVLYGEQFGDNVLGQNGADLLVGDDGQGGTYYSGNDTLNGGSGNDTLYSEAGSDTLLGEAGDDTLNGGDGADTYRYLNIGDVSQGNDYITESGDSAGDVLDFTDYNYAVDVDISLTTQQNVASNGVENRLRLTLASNVLIEKVFGSSGADEILGNGDANYLVGNGGDDEIRGAGGNDTIAGGTGSDLLYGGTGDDTFVFAGSSNLGTDTVNEASGEGTDILDFSSLGQKIDELKLAQTGSTQTVASGLLSLYLVNETIENAKGTAYADKITGNSLSNVIYGGAGNDSLYGGSGGNDSLYGEGDNDYLDVGDGVGGDYVNGGTGTNTVVYDQGDTVV